MRRTGEGGTSVDHAESHPAVESLARHEICLCGFDDTQKIRVYGAAPLPHARRRPKAAGEAYPWYVKPAAEGANEADGPFSTARSTECRGRYHAPSTSSS